MTSTQHQQYIINFLQRYTTTTQRYASKRRYCGPTIYRDKYRQCLAPGQPSLVPGTVKDVNQSLSSTNSAASIKPSSSTDSVPGYGREGPTRPELSPILVTVFQALQLSVHLVL